MKKLILSIITIILIMPCILAQNTPQGMKYQAIARDLSGEILANQKVVLKIKLQDNTTSNKSHYTEVHNATTNQFGLFSLVIGEGEVQNGAFNTIPWSTKDIWMSIDIKNGRKGNFSTISKSKLLAVPYAFHAATASKVVNGKSPTISNGPGNTPGVPSQNWSLFGNSKTNPEKDRLGTTDAADLVMVTNNIERLRITADGEIITGDGKFIIGGNLEVQGDSTTINKDLYVGRNVHLNFSDEFTPRGETINYGDFTVERASSTVLTGTLDVFKETVLKNTLTVMDDGVFEDDLTVKDTLFANNIVTRRLNIKDDAADGEYLATYENTNSGAGDGINIKLGKTHPGWDGGAYINAPNPVAEYFDLNIQNIRASLTEGDDFSVTDALSLIPAAVIVGTTCGLVEKLAETINDGLGLPISIGGLTDTDVFDAVNSFADSLINDGWRPDSPTTIIPGFDLGFPTDFCPDVLPTISMPNINFVNVGNSLTNDNHFIDFTDKENRTLGYVRAVSITEWGNDYFDGVYLTGFVQKSVGLDPLDVITGIVNVVTEIVDNYNDIGVEYASGNGDYAEWLERLDPNEYISKGDIVGVIGGKITKNLINAEQIMAISEKPIMLGNMPVKSKEFLGNNVAFMGQIPVKIIGEVNSGDYIIANSEIPGYGIAKNPSKVSIDDTKYIVGRSWETNLNSGPKMVNTVIGVHNGDYLKIIKKFQDEFKNAEKRLDNLEEKVEALFNNSSN